MLPISKNLRKHKRDVSHYQRYRDYYALYMRAWRKRHNPFRLSTESIEMLKKVDKLYGKLSSPYTTERLAIESMRHRNKYHRAMLKYKKGLITEDVLEDIKYRLEEPNKEAIFKLAKIHQEFFKDKSRVIEYKVYPRWFP